MTPLFENGFTSKRGRGGGVGCLVLQISSDGNDRMGAKIKTRDTGICRHYHKSSDSKDPKKFLLKSSHLKKYLPNFPTRKIPGIKNFKPKKILRRSPSLEIRSTPLGFTLILSPFPPHLCISLFQWCPCTPTPGPPYISNFCLGLKILWGVDTSAAKCMPRVWDEKESECLVPNRHCSSLHSSHSVEKCYFKGFNV